MTLGAAVLYGRYAALVPVRLSVHGAFHGGEDFCITASSVGGSFRMCEIHECHSGGTWEA